MNITIIFDGGTRNSNPGPGHGSYRITWRNERVSGERTSSADFGEVMTNNEAELHTLIRSLEETIILLDSMEPSVRSHDCALRILGDSQLVVNSISGKWDVTKPNLVPLIAHARAALAVFRSYDISWHSRTESVRILGH